MHRKVVDAAFGAQSAMYAGIQIRQKFAVVPVVENAQGLIADIVGNIHVL